MNHSFRAMQREERDAVLEWLLEPGEPVVRYKALTELMHFGSDDPEALATAERIPEEGWARTVLNLQREEGHWENSDDLYIPKYTATNWRALVLSDFGLTKKDPRVAKAAELFLTQWLNPNAQNIYREDVCIVGNTARMLTRFGYWDDPRVVKLFDRLVEDQKEDGGWHCFESTKGTLDCWEALAAYESLPRSKWNKGITRSAERGAEFYLRQKLFDDGQPKYLPWFRFHYPVHYYYDILVGLDVLTALGYGPDRRLDQAIETMKQKRSPDGKWIMDKIHPDLDVGADYGPFKTAPKPFVIEQEGQPSKWLTLKARIIERRILESRK
jgi:hypothetical protein